MAKKNRQDFFDPGADINSRGYRKNFKKDGEPDEALMQDHVDSVVHFAEDDDRAKQSTGGEDNKDLVGHVQIATDSEAKANSDGLEPTTTKVPHTGQLPTVDATESQSIAGSTPFSDVALEVADDGTSTRNNFLAKLSETFRSWLETLRGNVDTNTTDIATNTSNIATNTSNIATNAANITSNTNSINNIQSGGTLDVRESNVTIENPVNEMNFDGNDFTVQSFATGQVVISAKPVTIPTPAWMNEQGATVIGRLSAATVSATGSGLNWTISNRGQTYTRYTILNDRTILYSFQLDLTLLADASISSPAAGVVRISLDLTHTGKNLSSSISSNVSHVVVPTDAQGDPTTDSFAIHPITLCNPNAGGNVLRWDVQFGKGSIGAFTPDCDYIIRGQVFLQVNP